MSVVDPRNLFDVSGKTIIITGATGALGGSIARALAAAGANLMLSAGNAEALAQTVTDCRAAGAQVAFLARRPETEADANAIIAHAAETFGSIYGLIVASGCNLPKQIGDMTTLDFQSVMDANVLGSWLMSKAAGAQFISQGQGGKVVLISSVRGRHGSPLGYSSYCTSKAAVDGLTRALALEWGPHRINVNAIGPTVFRSNLTAWMFDDDKTGGQANVPALKRIPLGRLGEADDLTGILLYLVSPASDFCTGQVIYVDGGYTAG